MIGKLRKFVEKEYNLDKDYAKIEFEKIFDLIAGIAKNEGGISYGDMGNDKRNKEKSI